MRTLLILSMLTLTSVPCRAADAPAPAHGDEVAVEVLDLGGPERRVLRYAVAPGASLVQTMMIEDSTTTTIDGVVFPESPSPRVRVDTSIRVTDVRENGDFDCVASFMAFEALPTDGVDQRLLDLTNLMLDQMERVRFTYSSSARGEAVGKTTVDAPEDLVESLRPVIAQLQQAVDQSQVVLPDEAIGVGGSWRVTQPFVTNGMRLHLVNDYTVLALDEEGVTLAVRSLQDAEPQDVSLPGAPPEIAVRLISTEGVGEGESELLFAMPSPVRAEIGVVVHITIEVTQPGGVTQEVVSEAASTVSIRVAEPPNDEEPG